MAISNRAAIIGKMHKVLKRHYKPVPSHDNRSLLENLLYACCLQNAPFEKAEQAFVGLQKPFYDWNEVRVTTVSELAELMSQLPSPTESASHLKRILQSVFESSYSYDLEPLKKQNIGKTVKQLQAYDGTNDFVIAYVTQHSLGGHAIPLDKAALDVMYIVGAVDEGERQQGTVPGIERAVSKKKGIEFASLLHQFAADVHASPFQPHLRSILLEIAPDAQPRLPKRASRKTAKPSEESQESPLAADSKAEEDKAEVTKTPEKRPPSAARKKPAAKKKTGAEAKKATTKKKSATKQLARRKPR